MASGNKQPRWDIYEAAILLDGYLKTLPKNQPKSKIIKHISVELRKLAVNRGIEIDDIYRNENGISYQIQSMESAYADRTIYVPATALFREIVSIYRSDIQKYYEILREAKDMSETKQDHRSAFLSWVASAVSSQRYKWIEQNILKMEQLALRAKLIYGSIFEISDSATLETIEKVAAKDKIFQLKNRKLIKNINEDFMTYVQFCSSKPESESKAQDADSLSQKAELTNNITDESGENASVTHASGAAIPPLETSSKIASVLKEHYEYGFKYDSIREFMRFRQFADAMNVVLPDDDEKLKVMILSCGTVIDDKVYCKSNNLVKELQDIVDTVLATGASAIYYEKLFEIEQPWMETHKITSPDMLKEYMQHHMQGFAFSKKFMVKGSRVTEKEAVTAEMKRVWGESPTLTVKELHNRLPYIPLSNIWHVISGNDLFVLNAEGEYHYIDLFHITEEEIEAILDYVETACEENGFASLSAVPLGDIEEENYELTPLAIYGAIYKKVLSGRFHLNGKILTKDASELDAIALLKQYIKGKDECTFDEVAEKVIELTGSPNRQYAFQALYDDMVRVDKNRFVANKFIHFNVDEVDAVLDGFITDRFRAIRDVTTFAMFPLCGQNWNHYLLESYCYQYSRKYSLHVIHFNDKNAGIIAEKDFHKNYSEMLAIALAKTDVELSAETIGKYLFDTGYMAKSKYAKLNEIAQRASELRKER